jgi:hypothetical protein
MYERVDRAACVEQRRLRGRPAQLDTRQPLPVTVGPCTAVVEPDAVTQQQLREPVPATHQVDPHRLASADEIT